MYMNTIHCFLPFRDEAQVRASVAALRECPEVTRITLLAADATATACLGCDLLHIDTLTSSATVRLIAEHAAAEYILLYTKYSSKLTKYY